MQCSFDKLIIKRRLKQLRCIESQLVSKMQVCFMVFKASRASHKPRRWGRRESDEYGVVGVHEAVALDRHRRPGCRANGGGMAAAWGGQVRWL
jgi:hypothetical protein